MVEPTSDTELYLEAGGVEKVDTELQSVSEKMLNGRNPDNALLESIANKGANSYYYAHAPKDFSTEGAQHFKDDGKIYGGTPVLITTKQSDSQATLPTLTSSLNKKQFDKFSWTDENMQVKVYIDFDQFKNGKDFSEDDIQIVFEPLALRISIQD